MRVVGTGSYLPEYIVTNQKLAQIVDTSDEWITARTGIKERRISDGEEDSELAVKAARSALENSGLPPDEINLIIVATLTPDNYTPSVACIVQKELEIPNAVCFDLNAACSGFVYALNTAHCYMKAGMVKNAIIVGSETLSKIVDYSDRSTCVLFGDAAGAVVVQADEEALFYSEMGADGSKSEVLQCKHVPIRNIAVKKKTVIDYVHMDGHEVFKFVMKIVPNTIRGVVNKANLDLADIKYYILHQANKRMNEKVAERLDLDFSKFPCNLNKTGNTSAASIPVLLDEVNRQGKLNRGDKLVLCAFGGGLTWASVLLEW